MGDWWVTTGAGALRYSRCTLEELAHARPKNIYTTRDGLSGNDVFRLFEDSRGDIWISSVGRPGAGVAKWVRSTETIHPYSTADGISDSTPSAFCEDRAGNLWIGFYDGGLSRFAAGRFTSFTEADGLPAGFIRGLFTDSKGRLWWQPGTEAWRASMILAPTIRVSAPIQPPMGFRAIRLRALLKINGETSM